MNHQGKFGIQDTAGCLGANPSRAGMSVLLQTMQLRHMMSGGRVMIFDKGSSGETSSYASFLNNQTKECVAEIPVAAKTCAVGEEPPFKKKTDFVVQLAMARLPVSQPCRIS